MTDLPETLADALADGDSDTLDALATDLAAADSSVQKACADRLRTVADEDPSALDFALPVFDTLLTADEQSVRLIATKAITALATTEPAAAADYVGPLQDRLDDDFYYVRGRAAQALGRVAESNPGAIDSPVVVARLLNALSLGRTETRQYVAEALCRVAFGDPSAIRTVVDDLLPHLDDEDDLVRYHLTTALAVVAATHPSYTRSVVPALRERLDDENSYVRGRAAEALGLTAAYDSTVVADAVDRLQTLTDEGTFVADRAEFALAAVDGTATDCSDAVGDPAAIAAATADIREDITTPDGDGCPHCDAPVADSDAPFCPACGTPLPR